MATTTTKTETFVGKRVRRREDPRLITGTATYVEDIQMPGMNYGVMHPRHLDVFHIGGRAGDEPRVFAAANALANKSFGFGGGSGHGRLLLSRAGRGGLHRVDDVLVSGAATHVALQAVANLIFGG